MVGVEVGGVVTRVVVAAGTEGPSMRTHACDRQMKGKDPKTVFGMYRYVVEHRPPIFTP